MRLTRHLQFANMIISKENRKLIYSSLFKEGVMVAPKNFEITHPELEIPNLEVVKACQSLTSRGYVKTQFSWQWYFYTLTPEVSLLSRKSLFRSGVLTTGCAIAGTHLPPRVPSPARRDCPGYPHAPSSPPVYRTNLGCLPPTPRWRRR